MYAKAPHVKRVCPGDWATWCNVLELSRDSRSRRKPVHPLQDMTEIHRSLNRAPCQAAKRPIIVAQMTAQGYSRGDGIPVALDLAQSKIDLASVVPDDAVNLLSREGAQGENDALSVWVGVVLVVVAKVHMDLFVLEVQVTAVVAVVCELRTHHVPGRSRLVRQRTRTFEVGVMLWPTARWLGVADEL